jgi:putative ABC transport system permease protein
MRPLFVFRWAARDLRRRWLQVGAIALVIGIGTGLFSALGSTATWRRQSNDDSFERTAMYDVRVSATEGADAAAGAMLDVLRTLPGPTMVAAAEERLVLPTQVDASTDDETILVPGRVIGMDLAGGEPDVNRVFVATGDGRTLETADSGQPIVVLERNFAEFYDLPSAGTLRVAGGKDVRYVGHGLSPEYFFVTTEDGGFFAQANFAALFTSLETAQDLTGRSGRVNDLVISLRDGVDPHLAADAVRSRFDASATDLGVTVMLAEDERAYQVLYDDIEGDQRVWNVFAGLILLGATFAAFNLATRMVEAQRREIGIGMALGAPPTRLALRPALVGVQIAVLGALLGVGVGYLVIQAMRPIYTTALPLPVWHTDFQPSTFLQGAVLGMVLPLVATTWPVWRAIRVTPIDAISITHRTSRGGLAPMLRRLRWPVSAFRRMPLGNALRTPRRSLLTSLGIGAAIATLVAILGMLDSFVGALDRSDREVLADHPDRVAVSLDRFVALDGPELEAIAGARSVGRVEPVIRVGARLDREGREGFEVLLEVLDMGNDVWAPTVSRSAPGRPEGVLIAEKAASDLGVEPGDAVVLEHPAPQGDGFVTARTPVTVAGIHPSPWRFGAYVERSLLDDLGVPDVANQLYVLPATGSTADDVERELFEVDGVASVQPVAASTRIVKDSMQSFTAVFRVLQAFILGLALLMAYNATSINADERARERATLFAFGLPVRRVIGLETVEGLLYGIAGTAIGIGVGVLVVRWVTTSILSTTVPDMSIDVSVASGTFVSAAVLGVAAVALAPLLTVRRLRRMDVPGTLRIVE